MAGFFKRLTSGGPVRDYIFGEARKALVGAVAGGSLAGIGTEVAASLSDQLQTVVDQYDLPPQIVPWFVDAISTLPWYVAIPLGAIVGGFSVWAVANKKKAT